MPATPPVPLHISNSNHQTTSVTTNTSSAPATAAAAATAAKPADAALLMQLFEHYRAQLDYLLGAKLDVPEVMKKDAFLCYARVVTMHLHNFHVDSVHATLSALAHCLAGLNIIFLPALSAGSVAECLSTFNGALDTAQLDAKMTPAHLPTVKFPTQQLTDAMKQFMDSSPLVPPPVTQLIVRSAGKTPPAAPSSGVVPIASPTPSSTASATTCPAPAAAAATTAAAVGGAPPPAATKQLSHQSSVPSLVVATLKKNEKTKSTSLISSSSANNSNNSSPITKTTAALSLPCLSLEQVC